MSVVYICNSGDIYVSKTFRVKLGHGTGYCIYTWPSWDGCELNQALIQSRAECGSYSLYVEVYTETVG